MKLDPSVAPARWLSRYDRPESGRARFAGLVSEFQPSRFDGGFFGGSGLPWRRPGFNALAREALLAEARRNFRLETAVLGFVSLVCAWPIAAMIIEIVRFLR